MSKQVIRYTFHESVPVEAVEDSITFAFTSCEALYGQVDAVLEARFLFDMPKRICVIDASTPVSRDLNRFFTGFLGLEVPADAYFVEVFEGSAEEAVA